MSARLLAFFPVAVLCAGCVGEAVWSTPGVDAPAPGLTSPSAEPTQPDVVSSPPASPTTGINDPVLPPPVVPGPAVNRPPRIVSFAATPDSGGAPLQTTLAWSIEELDGDALSCAIDVGNDGSFEHALTSCASSGTQAQAFTAVGTHPVLLRVRDARGAEVTATLQVTVKPVAGDLRVSRVEWGQSVISENPRLVAGKQALLRVHVLGDRAGLSGFTVRAEATSASAALGALTLTGPTSPPTAEALDDLTKQYRALLPAAWVTPGVQVRVTVDPTDAVVESNESNNTVTLNPTVGAGTVLPLTIVPVVHQGVRGAVPSLGDAVPRVWPVRSADIRTRAPYTFNGTLTGSSSEAWGRLLQELAAARQSDGVRDFYYGSVRVTYGSGIAGIGYVGQRASVGRDDSVETALHELGHNMGREHSPCGGVAGADPNYPYSGGRIGSRGFDVVTGRLVLPSNTFDLMSYCNPSWVSDYSYRAVQTFLEKNVPPPASANAQADYLLVSGTIDASGVQLRPIQQIRARAPERTSGDLRVTLRGARGAETVSFAAHGLADLDHDGRHFTVLVPAVESLEAIDFEQAGRSLMSRRSIPRAVAEPSPELQEHDGWLRLRWNHADYPYVSVAHWSAEGRTTLSLWLTGGSADVMTDGLPAGGELELSFSDGLRTVRRTVAR